MGNSVDKGFSDPPQTYLREIRRKTNKHLKEAAKRRRRSSFRTSVMGPRKREGTITELDSKSVASYLTKNPEFLDTFIVNYIALDRVKAWLKDKKGDTGRNESDPDFAAELMERSFRHRQIMIITRSRLLYPVKYKRDELEALLERADSDEYEDDIESHTFPYTEVPPDDISKVFILMTKKLLGRYAFPRHELCYFLATLRANYLNIEYHNYGHALSHAQSMYWILRKNPGVFNDIEMRCLLVSAIAHDVGHPGVTDSYLKTTGGGLETLYMSPILEHHHTQTCFLILQDINCNIFCDLEGDDYKQVLDEIQHNILSTSLARYKVQCENMKHIIGTDLNFDNKRVRDAIKSVLMMTCDLCSCWKQWQEHKNIVWALYKEFYYQGDKESNFNIDSIPPMLRQNSDKIPVYQINFLETIAIPIFQIAVKVFPNILSILDSTKENLELWQYIREKAAS